MSNKPLSPHLQIYKVQINSFFSIMHRLTGILLYFLLIILSWYFILHIYFPDIFIVKCLNVLLSTPIAKLAYILSFISFTYHFLNGIRHLLWDFGLTLEVASISRSAVLLTVILFFSAIAFYLYLL